MQKTANNLGIAARECHRRAAYKAQMSVRPVAGAGKWTRAGQPQQRAANTSPDVTKVLTRIASMADREVRERYHKLVDESLVRNLTVVERFELERIEARLDAEDRDPEVESRNARWRRERTELLESIEDLLNKLRR